MKQLVVPKLAIDPNDLATISKRLEELTPNEIDVLNWAEQYPYKPKVDFYIAHNGDCIFLQYHVIENQIMAQVTDDNGPVWTDTCVEFFISFDNNHYYNAEFSGIGTTLLGYRYAGHKAEHANEQVLKSIKRLSTLGNLPISQQIGNFDWTLTLTIPQTSFWRNSIKTLDGLSASANFYKCGDHLTQPHFVSWTPIDTSTPNFHQPQHFGHIYFEA